MKYSVLYNFLEEKKILDLPDESFIAQIKLFQAQSSDPELVISLEHVLRANTGLYIQWIIQDHNLHYFLLGNTIKESFKDSQNLQKHSFFPSFQRFVEPFLSPLLLRLKNTDNQKERLILASYLILLPDDERALIEYELADKMMNDFRQTLSESNLLTDEKQLSEKISPFSQDEAIGFINHLSRASYAIKLEYTDGLLSVINFQGCTIRLANYLVKQTEKISLHKEHSGKLTELRRDLREGKIRVKNHGKKGLILNRNHAFLSILTLGIAIFSFWLMKYEPFKSVPEEEKIAKTAFSQYTEEERRQIDSLIALLDQEDDEEAEESLIDPFMGLEEVEMILREPVKNEQIEEYIIKIEEIHQKNLQRSDSCKGMSDSSFKKYLLDGFKALSTLSGKRQMSFKNESDYQVILMVFNDSPGKPVYMQCLTKHQEIKFKVDSGQKMIVLAGQKFDKTESYFCITDENTALSQNTIYEFDQSAKSGKMLVVGNPGSEFSLIDLKKVLI